MPEENQLPIPRREADAIQHFVADATLPILARNQTSIWGTATLFNVVNRYFIVTAAHVLEVCSEDNWVFPTNRQRSPVLPPIGRTRRLPAIISDVAVIEIVEASSIDTLRRGWRFLTFDNVVLDPVGTVYFLAGYPQSIAVSTDDLVAGHLLTAFFKPISVPDYAEGPVEPAYDRFFIHSAVATGWDGGRLDSPRLQGVSGGSVWHCQPHEGGIWLPERACRIFAVQSSARHGEYVRAKSWKAVIDIFEQSDAQLREAARGWSATVVSHG